MANIGGKIPLTLAVSENPRSMAIIDGTVKPEGIDLTCIHEFGSVRELHEGMMAGKYDASEMGTVTYIGSKSTGVNLIAIPVFFSRGFRHKNIFCHVNSGIERFSDLKGKSVGVTTYVGTAIVWARGMLHHQYDVSRESIRWIVAERDVFDIENYSIEVEKLNQSRDVLWKMVVKGEIDAAIFPGNTGHFSIYSGGTLNQKIESTPSIKMIQAEEKTLIDYYQKTEIYPILHSITIKQDVVSKNPEVAKNLLAAFRQSRELAANYMSEEEKRLAEGEKRLLGRDPYNCNLGIQDHKALDTLIDYLVEDGILDRKLEVESLLFRTQ